MSDNKVSVSQNKSSGAILCGGSALLVAWFLLFFSGEIWGLGYELAANSVAQLSLISIASCFFTALIINALGCRKKAFTKPGGYKFLVLGVLLSAATVGVTFGQDAPFPLFLLSCAVVGCCGAFFIYAVVLQLSLLSPRTITTTSGVSFLAGILIYSFAFYVPQPFTLIILCALPLFACPFFAFDTHEPFNTEGTAFTDDSKTQVQARPAAWRPIMLFSIFMLFSCVVRGYLPFTIDNETFSFIRSISIIVLLLIVGLMVIVSVLLSSKFNLGILFKGAFLFGVVFFALVPIFGTANAVVLVLADGYRGLCALLALTFFASMAHKTPFFGLKHVSGGLITFMAFAFIGWGVGTLLHYAQLGSDILRIYDSIQCILVLLAFILLFRQSEIDYFVDGKAPVVADSEYGNTLQIQETPEYGEGGGRWRRGVLSAARDCGLTAREEDVFLLLAKGYKAQNIADTLSVSYNTTRAHIRSIYQKCGIHSQQEFVNLIEDALIKEAEHPRS